MERVSHKTLLLLLVITPLLLTNELVIGFLAFSHMQAVADTEKKYNSLDLYLRTNAQYISYAETAQRGYLITGDRKFRDSVDADLMELKKNEDYYDSLPAEIRTIDVSLIQSVSEAKTSKITKVLRLYDEGHRDSAFALERMRFGADPLIDSIQIASVAVIGEVSSQVSREKVSANNFFRLFMGLIAVLILFNFFLAWYTYRKFTGYTANLERLVGSLQQANERMSEYTKQSYHELKTPLRNISGFAQLLSRRHLTADVDSEQREFVGHITDGIKQMNDTIDDMRSKYLDDDREGQGWGE
jgi:signal transduction histidine kinase